MIATPILHSAAARPWRDARVLLTGASGFIGQHIAQQGVAEKAHLFALGRTPGPAGTTFVAADLRDGAAIEAAVREIAPDLILHLGSPGVAFGSADFTEILTTLVTGGSALLSAAAALASPPHFVQTGSGLEYAPQQRPISEIDPIIPASSSYGAAKAAAAALLGGFHGALPITLVRPFNVYGAGDVALRLGNAIITKAVAGETINVSKGEQVRDFLHIDDFATLLWRLAAMPPAEKGFACFNAGSGKPRALREYIAVIATALEQAGVTARPCFGALPYRNGEPMLCVPDLTALHAACDWRPRVAFATGVINNVHWRLAQCA